MDACTYESITGLKNYYGFKSLLKNGGWTQRYGCDDDTIVFNRILKATGNNEVVNLKPNQVGVILNFTSNYFLVLTQYLADTMTYSDVNNEIATAIPDQLLKGEVFVNSVRLGPNGSLTSATIAIFDLY
jgi:hypothetical protein